jgi:hypothetical protein
MDRFPNNSLLRLRLRVRLLFVHRQAPSWLVGGTSYDGGIGMPVFSLEERCCISQIRSFAMVW